jgi:hypothetical protein
MLGCDVELDGRERTLASAEPFFDQAGFFLDMGVSVSLVRLRTEKRRLHSSPPGKITVACAVFP